MKNIGILHINIQNKTLLLDKIYGLNYTHIGVYYQTLNDNPIYLIKYEPLFTPFVSDVNNNVCTLKKIMEQGNIKDIKYATLNNTEKYTYVYNIIKSCINKKEASVAETIKNIYEEYDYNNEIFSEYKLLRKHDGIDKDKFNEMDVLNLENNTINSLRKTIYNAYTNNYQNDEFDKIAEIYNPNNNPDIILMKLSGYVCKLINMFNNALNNDNYISIDGYNKNIQNIKKIIKVINRKYVCINKCNNIIDLKDKTNDIIKFSDEYDNKLLKIYKHLYKVKRKIDNYSTPIININKFLDYYASLVETSGNNDLKLERCTNKYSLNAIIIPSYEYIKNKHIMVPLNEKNEIIISALNPNLDMFNRDELREILITLETYANGDPILDELRSKITALLV